MNSIRYRHDTLFFFNAITNLVIGTSMIGTTTISFCLLSLQAFGVNNSILMMKSTDQ